MGVVRIRITASVLTTVALDEGESIEDLQGRGVDIYLHGSGENGYVLKEDLGTASHKIEILKDDEE